MIDWQQRYEMATRIAQSLMAERSQIAQALRDEHDLYLQPDGRLLTGDEIRRLIAPSH